ncbi:hypothetical protein D3C72_1087600 [compost metagenome]
MQDGGAQLVAGRIHACRGAVGAPLAARPRRHGERGIPQPHDDFGQRHAQHFRGGLRDDGVAAGADVGHVGFHDDLAGCVQTHARGRFHHQVIAKRRRHAHAHQPAAFTPRARPRAPVGPPEVVRPHTQAFNQAPLRERALGRGGVHLRVVAHTEFHRVQLGGLGHFVHRDLQRHQPRRFARCAHRIAFGQVQLHQVQRGQPVGAGIEQARLLHGFFGTAAGQIA